MIFAGEVNKGRLKETVRGMMRREGGGMKTLGGRIEKSVM